jgi:pimeloyl-ACP methyl ester carboxylesterase
MVSVRAAGSIASSTRPIRYGISVLMLHGFPSSSRMFAGPIPQLADRYPVIAHSPLSAVRLREVKAT